MEIVQTNHLTDEQKRDIRALDRACAAADGADNRISLDNTINFVRDMDSFFLLYESGALIGLISVFAPTHDTAEISACVHPKFRRQGYFRQLLACACTEAKKCGYEKLLFVHESSMAAGKAIAQKWGLKIEHSEYLLHYEGGEVAQGNSGLEVRRAHETDLGEMARLSAETFGETTEDARHLVESAYRDVNRLNFVAFADGAMIGIGGVNTGEPELYIFGLGVSPRYQGKGYGRSMLAQIVREMQQTDSREIVLEVDSENMGAFHLYTSSGFKVRAQYDYYEGRTADYIRR